MNDAQLVMDIWETVRDHLSSAGRRAEVARGIMRAVREYGIEEDDVASVADEDDDLKDALAEVYGDGDGDGEPGHGDDEDMEGGW